MSAAGCGQADGIGQHSDCRKSALSIVSRDESIPLSAVQFPVPDVVAITVLPFTNTVCGCRAAAVLFCYVCTGWKAKIYHILNLNKIASTKVCTMHHRHNCRYTISKSIADNFFTNWLIITILYHFTAKVTFKRSSLFLEARFCSRFIFTEFLSTYFATDTSDLFPDCASFNSSI